jgi:haloacetate dehalogenase
LRDPERVHGLCEAYRGRSYADFEHDKSDLDAKKLTTPFHVMWGSRAIAVASTNPLDVWETWATQVTGEAVRRVSGCHPESYPEVPGASREQIFNDPPLAKRA